MHIKVIFPSFHTPQFESLHNIIYLRYRKAILTLKKKTNRPSALTILTGSRKNTVFGPGGCCYWSKQGTGERF